MVSEDDFDDYKNKLYYGRRIILKDDKNYGEILANENITNQSFVYANHMNEKAQESRIVMIEFLVVLFLIMTIFAAIINSMTINSEKRKIGIKYSFGMKKVPIIVPYIFETLLYVGISFVVSVVVVKWIFPFFIQTIIYTETLDVKGFDFFYIAWSTIIGWDVLIYAIMLVSLTWMILKILVKSPIEIIKDL